MTHVTLAVDAGGTSTRAIVVEPTGRCLGFAVSGSGNPTAVGHPAAAASVISSASSALERAGLAGADVGLVVLAMAGARAMDDNGEFVRRLAEIDVEGRLVVESDLLAAYFAGTHRAEGYAVVAGTGAAAIRVEDGRQVVYADGLGWLLGDEGSGFWIGQRVARAALADLDGRGPATALTPLLLRRLELAPPASRHDRDTIIAVVRRLYAAPPVRLADLAALVFEAAGDATADAIVRDAGDALARTLAAITSPSVTGPVVLGGGILRNGRALAERLVAASGATEVHTVTDGAAGAAVLALRHAGVAVDAAVFQTVITSLAELRSGARR